MNKKLDNVIILPELDNIKTIEKLQISIYESTNAFWLKNRKKYEEDIDEKIDEQ